MVEPPHLRIDRYDTPRSNHGSNLSRAVDILLYSLRCDSHLYIDLVGLSRARGGWRDVASTLWCVEQGIRDKHDCARRSHGFDFIPLGLSTFGSEAKALLYFIFLGFSSHFQNPEWEAHNWVFRCLPFRHYAWWIREVYLSAIN